jgi:hypothetical protein
MIRTILVSIAAGVLLMGCSGGESDDADAGASGGEIPAAAAVDDHAGHDHAADTQGEMTATATPVTVSGKMGCGHCTYQIGTVCSSALETADGKIYLLEGMGVSSGSELFDKRKDGLSLTVTGMEMEKDGVAVIAVTEHEIM